jgi:hypothetical protein
MAPVPVDVVLRHQSVPNSSATVGNSLSASSETGTIVRSTLPIAPSDRRQNPTLSPPLRSRMARASAGVAISRPSSSTMRRILATCSALEVASLPRPM